MSTTANIGLAKAAVAQAQKETTYNDDLDIIDAAFKGFIVGLRMEWVSASSIKVKTGAAQVPEGVLLSVAADITVSSISLGNNIWGHIYLYNSGSSTSPTAAVEVVTTAPALYFGTAYQKTGDSSRRYLGSVRTDGSGNIINFIHQPGNFIRYRASHISAPMLVLSGGTATTETDVDCSAAVPSTSRMAHMLLSHAGTTGVFYTGTSDDSAAPASGTGVASLSAGHEDTLNHPLSSNQHMTYAFSAAPGGSGGFLVVYGYWFDR